MAADSQHRNNGKAHACDVVSLSAENQLSAYDAFLRYQTKKLTLMIWLIDTTRAHVSQCFIEKVESEMKEQTLRYKRVETAMLKWLKSRIKQIEPFIVETSKKLKELGEKIGDLRYADQSVLDIRDEKQREIEFDRLQRKMAVVGAAWAKTKDALERAKKFHGTLKRRRKLIKNYNERVQDLMRQLRMTEQSVICRDRANGPRDSRAENESKDDVKDIDISANFCSRCGSQNPHRPAQKEKATDFYETKNDHWSQWTPDECVEHLQMFAKAEGRTFTSMNQVRHVLEGYGVSGGTLAMFTSRDLLTAFNINDAKEQDVLLKWAKHVLKS